MKSWNLYPKLAVTGIKKNRRLYLPYILTCIGMVAMFYIIHSLSYSPMLQTMRGGATIESILGIGKFVIAFFALIFLTYTNSFLLLRRHKEFGLYNVLGMDKRGIGRIIIWESLMIGVIGLGGGVLLGIAMSKFAELILLNFLRLQVDYQFTVSWEALVFTVEMFAVIFLFLLFKSLWQVRKSRPLELMKNEHMGEKPPKANWFLAVLGAGILGAAYYMAVSIQNPITALGTFFIAVLMVIAATYMLFSAGSVAMCKVLQKNKGYYYQKHHFISVSSMAFRMKRNGAGLASICILSTMVLVMLSSTSTLYIGVEDTARSRCPFDNEISVSQLANEDSELIPQLRQDYEAVFDAYSLAPQCVTEYTYGEITALREKDQFEPDPKSVNFASPTVFNSVYQLYFLSQNEYNRVANANVSLGPGEAAVGTLRCKYDQDTLSIRELHLAVTQQVDFLSEIGEAAASIFPSVLVVVPDYEALTPLDTLADFNGDRMMNYTWYYGYNLDAPDELKVQVLNEQVDAMNHRLSSTGQAFSYDNENRTEIRSSFYELYGGLFFLGILLSIVFLFAAVLIIYYKQLSEGYEDQSRFEIMQKVGMTKRDIRKSINSQVLTVFFAPLITAGLHLCFAFPLVWQLLQALNMFNKTLTILTTVGVFLVFGVFYAAVYKITARAYYNIVSGAKK